METAQERIDRHCEYRGVPQIKVGQRCEVDGRPGAIVDGNSSCNFDVLFDGWECTINCHPNWKMKIFESGELIYDSDNPTQGSEDDE